VFSATQGDHRQPADFAASMFVGVLASFVFLVGCSFGFRQQWSFPLVLVFGSTIWLAIVLLPSLVGRWFR